MAADVDVKRQQRHRKLLLKWINPNRFVTPPLPMSYS
jgi:hypothetical protein